MRLEHPDLAAAKGWSLGPWNSHLQVSIGFATRGIDDPHLHRGMDEHGEPRTFLDSSRDYFHFVLHTRRPYLASPPWPAE